MKTAVITDSTAYLPDELLEKYEIFTIPLSVVMGDETYRENVDITTDEFFEKMAAMDTLPTTSQPSIGDYILLLESLYRDGYTDVISFHLSAKISGTYQSAVSAGENVEGINVHVIDSEVAAYVQGFLALYAAQNKDKLSLEEIVENVEEMKKKENTNAYFIVDTLTNLQKGGRLSNAQALVGSLLKVKPILDFKDGMIVPYEKVRTKKKAKKKVQEVFGKEIEEHQDKNITAVIIHSNAEEEGREWKKEMESLYPHVTFTLSYFGPVIATHLGEGALGLGYTTFDVEVE
ncbi:DegV family protein [Salinicoccus sp. Marseille-QA3877]